MTDHDTDDGSEYSLNRRTALKAASIGLVGASAFTGPAAANGNGRGQRRGQACEDCPDGMEFIAKYEFDCVEEECVDYDEEEDECVEYECVDWDFVFEKGDDIVDIEYEFDEDEFNKDGEEAEPNFIRFEADGYLIQSVCVFGGNDTDDTEDVDGLTEFASDLENNGGQEAAISNVVFCGIEAPDPELAIDVECEPDSVAADGVATIEITGTVTHDDAPLEGVEVEISHDGDDLELDPDADTQNTDGDGQVVWSVSSDEAQSDVKFTLSVTDDFDQTAEDNCTGDFTELPRCPFYGTTMEDPTEIHGILGDPDEGIAQITVGDIGDNSPHDLARPNGLAFDDDNDIWYFADAPDEDDGVLYTMETDGDGGVEDPIEYENITGEEGEGIAGAAFWDATGEYLFIEEGGSQLRAATVDVGNEVTDVSVVTDLLTSDIGLGDLAIDRDTDILYISTASSADGQIFFSVDLNDLSEQEIIADEGDGDDRSHAINKQIAFEEREDGDDVLWAHHAWDGDWWTVDLETGEHVQDDPVAHTPTVDEENDDYPAGYSDLARCGFADVDGLREEDILGTEI